MLALALYTQSHSMSHPGLVMLLTLSLGKMKGLLQLTAGTIELALQFLDFSARSILLLFFGGYAEQNERSVFETIRQHRPELIAIQSVPLVASDTI